MTDCDAALREVAFSRKEFRESFHGQLLLAARYSRMSYREVRDATDAGEAVILDGFRLIGAYDSEYFGRWKEKALSRLDVERLLLHDTSVVLGANDQAILRAWKECKSGEGGLTMYITAPDDIFAVLTIEWIPFVMDLSCNPHVEEFIIQPAEGVEIMHGRHLVTPGTELGIRKQRTITLKRPAGECLLASLKMVEFGGLRQAYLPAAIRLSLTQRR